MNKLTISLILMILSVSLLFGQTDRSIKWWDVGSNQFKVQPIPFLPMDSVTAASVGTPVAGKGNVFIGLDRKMYAKWVDGTVTEIGGGSAGGVMTKQQIVDTLNRIGTNWLANNTWSFKLNSNNEAPILLNNPGSGEALRLTKHMYGAPSFVTCDQSITFYKDTTITAFRENLLGSIKFRKESTDSGAYFIFNSKAPYYISDPPEWTYDNVPIFTITPGGTWEVWSRPYSVTPRKMSFVLGSLSANRTITWGDNSGVPAVVATSPLAIATNGTVSLSGAVSVSNGGTGKTSLTANSLLAGNGTSPINEIAAGTANTMLQSNGTVWSAKQLYYAATLSASTDEVDVSITGLSATSVVYASWGKNVTSVPLGSLYVVSTGTGTCKIRSSVDEQNNHNIVVTVVSW